MSGSLGGDIFSNLAGVGIQAFGGYQRGKQIRRERDDEQARYDQERADKQAQLQASAEAMRQARETETARYADQQRRQQALDLRQSQADQRSAFEGGYIPQAQGQAEGAQLSDVGRNMGGVSGMGATAAGAMLQGQRPAFTLGTEAMVKGRESVQEKRDRELDAQRDQDRRERLTQSAHEAEANRIAAGERARESNDMRREIAGMAAAGKAQGKKIPAAAMKSMIDNDVSLTRINDAMGAVDRAPSAFGNSNRLGGEWIKNNVMGATADEQQARAAVGDIGSQVIHDRSGAAVTVSEYPRLRPFIPAATDPPQLIKSKLAHLKSLIQEEADLYRANYGPDQGYVEYQGANPVSKPGAPERTAPAAQQPATPRASAPSGTRGASMNDPKVNAMIRGLLKPIP